MPDHTHAERLAAIHARAAVATPGPWRTGSLTDHYWRDDPSWHHISSVVVPENIAGNYDYEAGGICSSEDDAEFIAHAREDIPYLLEHTADLEARLVDLEASPAIAGRPLPEHATLHFDPDELADADADFSTIELDPAKVRRAAAALD